MTATLLTPTPSRPERHIPGEAGLWVLILGEMSVFAVLFTYFLYQRTEDPGLFRQSQQALDRGLGALNTLILLTSSLLVALALRAVRAGDRRRAPLLFAGALTCGLGFAAVKGVEYSHVFGGGITPSTNTFYTYYLVLTGLHLFHVTIGTGLLVFMILRSRHADGGTGRLAVIEGCTCFWHMVDLIWVILFPLVYLVR